MVAPISVPADDSSDVELAAVGVRFAVAVAEEDEAWRAMADCRASSAKTAGFNVDEEEEEEVGGAVEKRPSAVATPADPAAVDPAAPEPNADPTPSSELVDPATGAADVNNES